MHARKTAVFAINEDHSTNLVMAVGYAEDYTHYVLMLITEAFTNSVTEGIETNSSTPEAKIALYSKESHLIARKFLIF